VEQFGVTEKLSLEVVLLVAVLLTCRLGTLRGVIAAESANIHFTKKQIVLVMGVIQVNNLDELSNYALWVREEAG
jgi:uncharacterized membrane-anchored protein